MPNDVRRMLRLATAAVVVTSYLALYATPRFDVGILIIPIAVLALMPVAERLDRRSASYRMLTSTLTFLFVICLPVLLSAINLLDAVVALVIYIQVYSILHDKQQRNYNHILLMSFFLLLAASVLTPSPLIGIVLLLFVMAGAWMLILLEMHSGAQTTHETSPPEIVGFTANANVPQKQHARLLDVRMTGWILVCTAGVLAFTALLFFASPRLEAGLFGAAEGDLTLTALSRDIDLNNSGGSIVQDTRAVMQVKFPEEEDGRFTGDMFWRSTALDFYTGTGWTRRGLTTSPESGLSPREFTLYSSKTAFDAAGGAAAFRQRFNFGREVVQEIFLTRNTGDGIPALQLVRAIEPADEQDNLIFRWDQANDFSITTVRRSDKPLQYRVYSEVYQPTPSQLRATSTEYRRFMNRRDYETLTGHNLLPRTVQLVRTIVEGRETPFDKLIALQRYLSPPNFQYTLDVPDLPAVNPIDAFIHDTRAGHCQLFATALALMARSEGIPTRLVSGYRGGTWVESDQAYTVSANMAHVWVEAFFPEYGWIPFDPSPPADEFEGLSIGALRRAISQVALKGKLIWYQDIVGFAPENRTQLLKSVATGIVTWNPLAASSESNGTFSILGRLARWFPVIAAAIIAAFALYAIARRFRRPDPNRLTFELTPDQQRAIRLREALCERLEENGIPCNGHSVDELRDAIQQEPWDHTRDALDILAVYSATRFGERPLPKSLLSRTLKHLARFRPLPS